MWLDAAADLEAIDFIQGVIGSNGRKLQNLIVEGIATRCLGIIEDECHEIFAPRALTTQSLRPEIVVFVSTGLEVALFSQQLFLLAMYVNARQISSFSQLSEHSPNPTSRISR
jgi:hypothetical protein